MTLKQDTLLLASASPVALLAAVARLWTRLRWGQQDRTSHSSDASWNRAISEKQ